MFGGGLGLKADLQVMPGTAIGDGSSNLNPKPQTQAEDSKP